MTFRRAATIALLPLALAGALVLAVLAVVALRAASAVGEVEAWLMAWMLAFVVGLPLALPLLALLRPASSRIREEQSHHRDNYSLSPTHRGLP